MSLAGPRRDAGKGLRFLSFDGGGIRAVSQALMVKEMMNRVEADCQLSSPPRICDYFDMICGSGFGGILAIMSGILKMTGDQLVHEFVSLCKAVFSEGLDANQRTVLLEREMKRIIGKYSTEGEERRMFCKNDTCKTFVCAAAFHNTGHPRLFRNYHVGANPSIDCMLWEAACATTSMPDLFKPIVIGDMNIGEMFVGGDLRWNNPTEELTREAADVFKGGRICSIISIGSGHSGHMTLSKGLADLFSRIALDCERVADDMECRFGNTPDVFWRLNVEQGLQGLAVNLSNLNEVVTHTHSYLRSARTTRSINTLLQDLIRCPERIPVDGISGVVPAVSEALRRKPCPPSTQHFTGRASELNKLDDYFSSNRKSRSCRIGVLYGIGGGGKSQMGLEFVRRSNNRFSDVFFADASDKFTLENDLKTIALAVSDKPTIDDALYLLRKTKEEWLLFLDNADDPSLDLRPYILWPHGNVLITTRNREVRVHAQECNIWVDKLELDDAVELLLRGLYVEKTVETYKTAYEIVQTLGCLALAVNQARGFLAQDICTLSKYLSIYMQNRQKLLDNRSIQTTDDYEHTVYTTWTISFNKLSSHAIQLLQLLCFMHHESIPSRIFEDAWKVYKTIDKDAIPPWLSTFLSSFEAVDSTWDILRFRMLVKEILSFSLIEFNTNNHILSLHLLVQQWAQSALKLDEHVLALRTEILGKEHPDTLISMNNLASTYSNLGQHKDALKLNEQVLALMAQIQGEEHPFTLSGMNNLANTYSLLGQHKDALKLGEQALVLGTRILGEGHPDTLISVNNLVSTYSNLGQHKDALKLNEQVLALSIQVLGEKHPDTLASMSNRASTYSDLGQYRDALKLEGQILALRTVILGKEHPDTLTSMNNLAMTYSHLGQHKDVLKLKEQVLVLSIQVLGEEHPYTLTSMSNLAMAYSDLGQHKVALKLDKQVLALRTQILGKEHPDTLISMNNLAMTYSHLDQHRDALTLKEQVLALMTHILGEDHPSTLTSMSNLAMTYSDLGQHTDALKLDEQVLALRTQILGEEHPDTLTSMNNLAMTYSHLDRCTDALTLKQQVLALMTRILGEDHPSTLTSMNNLAYTYSDLGLHKDALTLKQQVMALMTQILGEDHPSTLTSMNNLAYTYSDLGQHRKALELHEQTLRMCQKILGPKHLNTINSFERVEDAHAMIASEQGRQE
ncbi:hypothetical protein DL96DRAFT_1810700 [Flagelloscypha sp. PMI_526]|nr:hypothetical protein DL96DRAFT_1810700 [Flagelloscypha sp. PMI_526]